LLKFSPHFRFCQVFGYVGHPLNEHPAPFCFAEKFEGAKPSLISVGTGAEGV
jgi:hypothetical protein